MRARLAGRYLFVTTAGVLLGLFGACSHARPGFNLGESLLIRTMTTSDDINPDVPLDIEIQIANRSRRTAHFGDERDRPWIQVILIDVPELTDEWIGRGESLPPFAVAPGESLIVKRRISLENQPPGKYLVQFEPHLKRCNEFPVATVPAIVELRAR